MIKGNRNHKISFDVGIDDYELIRKMLISSKGEETLTITQIEPSGEVKIYDDCSFVISKDGKTIEWFNEKNHGLVQLK